MEARAARSAASKNRVDDAADASPPSDAWLFAKALRGEPVITEQQVREFVAAISSSQPQYGTRAAAGPSNDARLFAKALRGEGVVTEEQLREFVAAISTVHEGTWNPADHPRKGYPPDGGEWVKKGGASGSSGTETSPSFLDAVIRRNQTIAGLTGVVTPGMIRSNRIATELQSAARLPGEVARAAAAGLATGGKAVLNGFATAVKSVATLGLSTSQLELIGVTKEDRDRGYDTAVAISTASGQVLIAVGTGGVTSALSKGGSIAQAASGALIAFDAAGNAVGVVQGVYDATQNGVDISNGTQVAAGLLGLGANVKAARALKAPLTSKGVAQNVHRATFGQSSSANYKKTFFEANPKQEGQVIVHHAVEQQTLSRYPGVVTESEIHSLDNLRGIPNGINADFHLSNIRKEWNSFYKQNPNATKHQLLDKATEIDKKYGHLFDPPIR